VYGDKHEEIHNYVQNLHVSEQQTTFISSLSNQQPNFYVSAPSAPQTTNDVYLHTLKATHVLVRPVQGHAPLLLLLQLYFLENVLKLLEK
jgi:hypothetical protein